MPSKDTTTYEGFVADRGSLDEYKVIKVDRDGPVLVVTMNEPDSLNALSPRMTGELVRLFNEAGQDDEVAVVVITGAGSAFCAGGDLRLMQWEMQQNLAPIELRKYIRKEFGGVIRGIANFEKPVIAAVNGAATGMGWTIAGASDIVIASTEAKFGMAYIHLALAPVAGSSYFLAKKLGYQKALEIIWTGDMVGAEEAARLGIANRVVPHAELLPETLKLAHKIARRPPIAVRYGKVLVRRAMDMTLEETMTAEEFAEPHCFKTDDHREGVIAFFEGRKPEFKGR